MRRITTVSLFGLKLAFTALPLWFVASRVDFPSALTVLSRTDGLWATIAVALALVQVALAGVRLVAILNMVGKEENLGPALRITWIGAFFSQALVSFVSGDVARVWLLSRRGMSFRSATNAVLLDRVFGVIALVFLILAGLVALLDALPSREMQWGAATTTAAFVFAIAVFLLLGWLARDPDRSLPLIRLPRLAWIGDFASAARYIFTAPAAAAAAMLYSLAVQVLSVVTIFVLFRGMGATVSLWTCFVFVPFVMLIAMLPISVAGWGVRETAMIVGFTTLSIASETILAVSIAFGIVLLVTSLPGAAFWLLGRDRIAAARLADTDYGPSAQRLS